MLICVQNPLSSEKTGEGPFSEGESVHRLHFGWTGRTIGKKGDGVKKTRKRWYRKTSFTDIKNLQKCFLNENDVNCGNTNLNSMAGKPVVASPNVGCFLRLKFNEDLFIKICISVVHINFI